MSHWYKTTLILCSRQGATSHTSTELPTATVKPPSKVAKGHEFTELKTRSGRQVTVSERARGSLVLK